VTLLWPSPNPGGYALLADGRATLRETPDGKVAILIEPTSAVLHVTAPARG